MRDTVTHQIVMYRASGAAMGSRPSGQCRQLPGAWPAAESWRIRRRPAVMGLLAGGVPRGAAPDISNLDPDRAFSLNLARSAPAIRGASGLPMSFFEMRSAGTRGSLTTFLHQPAGSSVSVAEALKLQFMSTLRPPSAVPEPGREVRSSRAPARWSSRRNATCRTVFKPPSDVWCGSRQRCAARGAGNTRSERAGTALADQICTGRWPVRLLLPPPVCVSPPHRRGARCRNNLAGLGHSTRIASS